MTKVIVRKRWYPQEIGGVMHKRCRHCARWFPATPEYFHRKGQSLHSECKPCGRAIARDYQRDRYLPTMRINEPREPAVGQSFDATALIEAMR